MTHAYQWFLANQAWIYPTLACAISEALPFIKSTKWNGLLQGLLTLLQKKAPPAPPAAN